MSAGTTFTLILKFLWVRRKSPKSSETRWSASRVNLPISSFASAMGMNTAGETLSPLFRVHRINASADTVSPVRLSTIGW
ncbi:Uncharacterised protein [Mycobacterium tuberculosis]|nr:Uncharacterised protein [Mycobacterium tuberculosis]